MRILRPAILAAALGVALLCGAIPAQTDGAIAAGLPSVSVRPDFAKPGETISVTASCRTESASRTLIISRAFDPVTLTRPTGASDPILADTVVIRDVGPGKYIVNSTCDDNSGASTTLTILAAGAPHLVPEHSPQQLPQGGAHTGGGSMAPNRPPSAAVGTVLVASGLGLVAVSLRRRFVRR